MEGMKYLKLFENFQDIDSLCKKYGIGNYTIGSDGSVDVDGYVYLSYNRSPNIPIKFGKVRGGFDCSNNKLSSLEGCPKEVGDYFDCSYNQLTSLEGCPEGVGGWFNCHSNHLSSLKGCPNKIGVGFYCSGNELTSLERCPKEVDGDFDCCYNQLTSLEGSPKKVNGYFKCYKNKLTSLEGCPNEVVGNFDCSWNLLTIIDYLPEWIEGNIDFIYNKIRDIKVEDKNYMFYGKCNLENNPINDLFRYWEGDLKNFIIELEFEDFIRDGGKSLDITRFEYALNGKEYDKEDIKKNYNLIYKK